MQQIGDILKKFDSDKDKYISREFQKYGYDLAQELGDLKNVSLYIKLAKITPRGILETARNFIKDAYHVQSRPKLFMWKLQQLKNQRTEKPKNQKTEVLEE
jgi:hypothetical protein